MVPFVRCFAQYAIRRSPSRRFHARHQYPPPPLLLPTWRPFYTSRRHGTRDIHRGTIEGGGRGTGPKAKGNGTARFRIKLFSLSYPQRQPFCPGKRYSSGCSCYGEGWFPATVGCRPCIRLPLSLTEKEAMEERRKIRGFRSRWRESAEAFQVSLPFTRFMPRFVSGCL